MSNAQYRHQGVEYQVFVFLTSGILNKDPEKGIKDIAQLFDDFDLRNEKHSSKYLQNLISSLFFPTNEPQYDLILRVFGAAEVRLNVNSR
jgi:hypothetical protein